MTQAYLYAVERRGACDTYGIYDEAVARARHLAKIKGQEYHVLGSLQIIKPKEPVLEELYPSYDPKINAPKEQPTVGVAPAQLSEMLDYYD